MKQNKCRVFLKDSTGLKQMLDVRAVKTNREGVSIHVQLASYVVCSQLELGISQDPSAAGYYHITSNGVGSHFTLRYKDQSGYSNYINHFSGDECYKHKKCHGCGKIEEKKISLQDCPGRLKVLFSGMPPESFAAYLNNKAHFPFFPVFATYGIPLLGQSKERGDKWKRPPGDNDIVIDELKHVNQTMNISAFVCSKGHCDTFEPYPYRKVIKHPQLPDYGAVVIFGSINK